MRRLDLTPEERIARKKSLDRAYYERNRDSFLARASARYVKRPPRQCKPREEIRARNRVHHHANRDKRLAQKRAWYEANKHKGAAYAAHRRAVQRQATPAWADRWMIEETYEIAKVRSEATGITWEVDHIVPLISDQVCGLHVIDNLRVIPRRLNRSKGNWHWPGKP